jgi:CHAT domain-containing protein/tetratricopeptide (TPR) repeat protein
MSEGKPPATKRTPIPPPVEGPPLYETYDRSTRTVHDNLELFTAKVPELAGLLRLPEAEQPTYLRGLSSDERHRLYSTLVTIVFHLARAGEFTKALWFTEHELTLVEVEPENSIDSYLWHSTARNRGAVLEQIGGIREGAGDLGAALAAYLEADVWFQRDAELTSGKSNLRGAEFDRLFHQQDFRSNLYATIANVYRKLNDPARVTEYEALAHRHSKRGPDPHDRAMQLISRGNGALDAGDLDQAMASFRDAIEVAEKSKSISGQELVQALRGLARVYVKSRLHRRALDLLDRALAINRKTGAIERQQADLELRSEAKLGSGDRAGAIADLIEALRCCTVEAPESSDGLDWLFEGERRRIVRIESATKILLALSRAVRPIEPERARPALEMAARLVERLRARIFSADARIGFQETSTTVFDELIDLAYEEYEHTKDRSRVDELFTLIERAKSRVLAELIADQRLSPPDVDRALILREAELLRREATIESRLASGAASINLAAELDAVRSELEATWDRIATATTRGSEYVDLRRARVVSATELRAAITAREPKAVVVNYYASPKRLIAITMQSDAAELDARSTEVGRAQIRDLVAVTPKDPPSIDRRLPFWQMDLPQLVVDPIRDALTGYPVVILIPHDVLHGLPLHALAAKGKTPLISDVAGPTIAFAPSASILRHCLGRKTQASPTAFVLGAPDRPDEAPLRHAADEAVEVARVFGTEPVLGPAAKKATFIANAIKARSIHIACHNRFDPGDPLASALLLSDGDLTARDILGVELEADLVVLSACQSGVSGYRPGDELMGIVRALLIAGAPSIVVTLWNAYDETTSKLMRDFYVRRIRDEQPKAAALCAAQRALASRSVAQWAPFVLIGAWR